MRLRDITLLTLVIELECLSDGLIYFKNNEKILKIMIGRLTWGEIERMQLILSLN